MELSTCRAGLPVFFTEISEVLTGGYACVRFGIGAAPSASDTSPSEVNFGERWQSLSAKILLVTALDDTHRQPLLESEGYTVKAVPLSHALAELNADDYHAALVSKEQSAKDTLALCEELKQRFPQLRVAIIAQRAEYVATSPWVDAIIRQQHSPRMFLSAVRRMLERDSDNLESRFASGGN